MHLTRRSRLAVAASGALLVAVVAAAQQPTAATPRPGRSDPAFAAPSIGPGVDYTVPSEAEIKAVLDRIRDHFVRSTPYRIVDTATGARTLISYAYPIGFYDYWSGMAGASAGWVSTRTAGWCTRSCAPRGRSWPTRTGCA